MSNNAQVVFALTTEFCGVGLPRVTIGTVPDDVLLEIFFFYGNAAERTEEWHTLVHVCRRWRYVAFASPRHLQLRLLCTAKTPVRKMLHIWPALSVIVHNSGDVKSLIDGADNIMAALEHPDRICRISLGAVPMSILERFIAIMKYPFPELTSLTLLRYDSRALIVPESFLGGSAPRLRLLECNFIPFPAIRKLHLIARDLVHLRLVHIPPFEYISPEMMVACLSSLTKLDSLCLGFHPPHHSLPGRESRRLPLSERTVLPALTTLDFRGASEYFEDFISRIDLPLLDEVAIRFFNQPTWNTPQLPQFIRRSDQLMPPNCADLIFHRLSALVRLSRQAKKVNRTILTLRISCQESGRQLSSLAQICGSSLPPLSTLERLYIHEDKYWQPRPLDYVENTRWIELLRPFTAVKSLYLSMELGLRVAPALQELTPEAATEVLPALQNLCLEGLQPSRVVQEAIGQFVAARLLFNRPTVTVNPWERGV